MDIFIKNTLGMYKWCHQVGVLLIGLFMTGIMTYFSYSVLHSTNHHKNHTLYDSIGSSIVSAITMNDRWVNYRELFGSIPLMNESYFSFLVSGLTETYNSRIFLTRRFEDEVSFYSYISARYTEDQVSAILSDNTIEISNTMWPIVFAYPSDISLVGFDVGSINSVRDSIENMERTGQSELISEPKLSSYDPDTILYGTPIETKNDVESFIAVQLSIEDALEREIRITQYLKDIDIRITLLRDEDTTSIYSSHGSSSSDESYGYTHVWTPFMDIHVSFCEKYASGMWYIYTTLVLGVLLSVLLTYVDFKYEKREDISSQKSLFLSSISHEMRTPMNGILGTIEEIASTSDEESQTLQNVHSLRSCADHLMNIISNIIDLSHIESNNLHVTQTTFCVSEINDHIQKTWTSLQKLDNIDLEIMFENIPMESQILGDVVKINQVLYNLLSNSAKFTKEGCVKVFLRWEQAESETDYGNIVISVTVKDTGVGIPSHFIPYLFKPFDEGRNNASGKGAGIGLSVSRSLAVAMSGTLEFKKGGGTGSEFVFRFNVFGTFTDANPSFFKEAHEEDKTISRPVTKVVHTPGSLSNYSALVVDDNILNIKVLRRVVTQVIGDCDTASCGFKAIEMCRDRKYDVIFMDKFMPECDGLKATEKIRKSGKNKDTCIIFVTADTTHSSIDECLNAGAMECISKPVVAVKIHELIKKYVLT